jgi:predicted transcriptional regulator
MEAQLVNQQAYLLDRILQSPDRRGSRSAVLGAKLEMKELGLDAKAAQAILDQLVTAGHLTEHKKGKGISYSVTDAGAQYRTSLLVVEPEPEPVDKYRKAFLLLQLLCADGHTVEKGAANRFGKLVTEGLELTPKIANDLRAKLTKQGHIRFVKDAKPQLYKLTPSGRKLLGTMDQSPALVLPVKGSILNELRTLARDAEGAPEATKPTAPRPENLSQAAFEVFQELRRERYSHTTLVPIFAVRRLMTEKFGPDVTRHEVLDDAILDLWRQKRVRIIPISDLRDSTEDQRADSIGDSKQTLFYME